MRLNKFIASTSNLSRRGADEAIKFGRVTINGEVATIATNVNESDTVRLDGRLLVPRNSQTILLLNKPVGYVCSRRGQGSSTIYDLLPLQYHHLKSVGRLDKDSSGLLLLTDDGELANQLTHPSFQKQKVYEVSLNKPLAEQDLNQLRQGVELDDGISKFTIEPLHEQNSYLVTISEGRNRQIRRTFQAIGFVVTKLHRTKFGNYVLPSNLEKGEFSEVDVL
jgi:23S rRNA pseudouridine2605 synthase